MSELARCPGLCATFRWRPCSGKLQRVCRAVTQSYCKFIYLLFTAGEVPLGIDWWDVWRTKYNMIMLEVIAFRYTSPRLHLAWMIEFADPIYNSHKAVIISPVSTNLKGGILVSRCPPARLSVCERNRVRFVSSTILGSTLYLYILSSSNVSLIMFVAKF